MNGYMYEPYLFMYRMNDLKREKTASEQNIVYIYIYIYISIYLRRILPIKYNSVLYYG